MYYDKTNKSLYALVLNSAIIRILTIQLYTYIVTFYSEPKEVVLNGNFALKENTSASIECSFGETNPNINRVVFLVGNKEVQNNIVTNTETVSQFSELNINHVSKYILTFFKFLNKLL